MFVFTAHIVSKSRPARIVAKWIVTRMAGFWYNLRMLFAFAVLAAAMTQLSDIATAVEANTIPPCPDFCVTGAAVVATIAFALKAR